MIAPRVKTARLPLETWGRRLLLRLQTAADERAWSRYGFEFLMFGIKQGWACLFGASLASLLFGSRSRSTPSSCAVRGSFGSESFVI